MTTPLIGITTSRQDLAGTQRSGFSLPGAYVEAVSAAGGLPILLPGGLTRELLRAIFDRVDGLVLSGGGDVHPRFYGAHPGVELVDVDEGRDEAEIDLALWSAVTGKPLLAICRGLQILNVALGGSLYQDIHTQYSGYLEHNLDEVQPDALAHQVTLHPDSKLASVTGKTSLDTNSRHHQAIREPAAEVFVAAHASDGIIEAIELPDHPYGLGVQWHPENLLFDPASKAIFAGLIAASTP